MVHEHNDQIPIEDLAKDLRKKKLKRMNKLQNLPQTKCGMNDILNIEYFGSDIEYFGSDFLLNKMRKLSITTRVIAKSSWY